MLLALAENSWASIFYLGEAFADIYKTKLKMSNSEGGWDFSVMVGILRKYLVM